ncbi:MAG: hypothetical protein AB7F43_07810 [Bacteriovoracia bacterium]
MTKRGQKSKKRNWEAGKRPITNPTVPSILDAMEDGNEYGSIVSKNPANPNVIPDIRRALSEIEKVRSRKCLCYIANVVKPSNYSSISDIDDLPFNEMVSKVPNDVKSIDIMVVTNGGSAQQVAQFADTLRPRFDSVEFILPYKCMSAGTLWVLSGDRIWMDERAFLGPIDPQEPIKDGTYVPSQAILTLVKMIQAEGQSYVTKGQSIPWSLVRLLDNIDHRRLGNAMTITNYVKSMAAEFLINHKFKTWETHSSSGLPVTGDDRKRRADEVASLLASSDRWKSHGHGLSREVVENELRIKVDRVESVPNFQRALRRFWAMLYWTFDRSPAAKMTLSQEYCLIRNVPQAE